MIISENRYLALQREAYYYHDFFIVALRRQDIYKIKEWRNSQLDVLRQKRPLTDADQENYYINAVEPTFKQANPKIMLFSFIQNDSCIGYGGLTNIDWEARRFELSFLVDPAIYHNEEQYENCFSAFITLIKRAAFEDLGFNRMFTETYDIRPFHISILEKNGFRFEGRMLQHVIINEKFIDSLIHGFLKEYNV